MTITLKQREPDKYTHEQHTYIIYKVAMVTTVRDGYGDLCIKVVKENGQQVTYSIYNFDLEVHG